MTKADPPVPSQPPAAQSDAVAWLIERKDGYVEITRHKEAADGWASVAKITPLGPLATPPPARDDIAEVLKRFHRNSCYPDASPGEVEIGVDAILAVLSSQGATREVRSEEIAMTLCLVDGRDPDAEAPLSEMCTDDNQSVPWWMVYVEYAEAILKKFSVHPRSQERNAAPKDSRIP